jgi:hypothetical protein
MGKHKQPMTWQGMALKVINKTIRILLHAQGKLIMMKGKENGINR